MMDTAPPREDIQPQPRVTGNRLLLGAGLILLLSVGLIPLLTGRNINYELTLAITILYFAVMASSPPNAAVRNTGSP